MRAIVITLAALAGITAAHAEWKPEYGSEDPTVRAWFSKAMQPDTARPVSCCGAADAYWADSYEVADGHYIAIITDDRKIPARIDLNGQRIAVPDNKLPNPARQIPNPTGHGIIFVMPVENDAGPSSNPYMVFCYFPPGGV
jgi:hypothetical protein